MSQELTLARADAVERLTTKVKKCHDLARNHVIEIGRLLAEIKEEQDWVYQYEAWDEFLAEEFPYYTKRHWNRLIKTSKNAELVGQIVRSDRGKLTNLNASQINVLGDVVNEHGEEATEFVQKNIENPPQAQELANNAAEFFGTPLPHKNGRPKKTQSQGKKETEQGSDDPKQPAKTEQTKVLSWIEQLKQTAIKTLQAIDDLNRVAPDPESHGAAISRMKKLCSDIEMHNKHLKSAIRDWKL